ncbi:hypothetical protein ABPG72_004039 [Tetrahymena utriculariae]
MSQLVWEIVKNNNAFLVKNNGVAFTTDPFSVTGRNTQVGLGFTHRHGVSLKAGAKQAIATSLRKNQSHKAKKTGTIEAETLTVKGGVQRVAKVIRRRFQSKGLKQFALKKLVNFHRANVRAQANLKAESKSKKN